MENALPGTSDWLITNVATETDWGNLPVPGATTSSNAEVEGYASETSVNAGSSITFHVNTTGTSVQLRFFRLGWYGGLGAREVTQPVTIPGVVQPPCAHEPITHRIDCNWNVSHLLNVPSSWVTGVYLVKATSAPSGKQTWIPFVVRNEARTPTYVLELPVTTWQAYNSWGGFASYPFEEGYALHPRPGADEVSFDRPYLLGRGAAGTAHLFAWDIHLLRYLEREGRDVGYLTGIDVHARPVLLDGVRGLLSVGHDEYWTMEMRDRFERARNECTDLGFFSANTAFWQVRLASDATSAAPFRRMIAYKEDAWTHDPLALDADPANDRLVTHQFRHPEIGRPEASLLGVMYAFWPLSEHMVVTNTTHPDFAWVFAGTGLEDGDVIPNAVGYEADRIWGSSPIGTVPLASSPVTPSAGGQFFCTPAGCRSHASIYQAPGGALVFATGSIQWVWRLDDLLVPGVPPGALDPYRFPPAERMARNLLDAFRDSPCIETPEWSPPVIPPEFTLALPVAAPGVTLVVDRCQAPGCLRAKQELGPKFSVVLLHPADFVEVEPPPLPPQLPPLPGFAAVSELFVPSLLGPVPQGASVVELTYDEQGMSPQVEKQVALFAFTDLGQGPVWHPLQVRRDVARNAVRATVGSVAPFVLALPDGDADGVANALDNCAAEPNPGQSDTGGVEPAGPDGIGDACQCGDVDDDGVVRAADRAQLRAWLAGQAPSLPAPQKCSVSAPQSCSIVDATRLARALGASLPPLAQVCAAAN